MTREELIEAGARALPIWTTPELRLAVGAVLDACEPLIRADERAKPVTRDERRSLAAVYGYEAAMAELRAKVEALRDNAEEWRDKSPAQSPWISYVGAYDHVLDLIDLDGSIDPSAQSDRRSDKGGSDE